MDYVVCALVFGVVFELSQNHIVLEPEDVYIVEGIGKGKIDFVQNAAVDIDDKNSVFLALL